MENLYELLEVSEKASQEIIEKAYKTLAKKWHPDLQEGSNKALAEEKMKKINNAYSILSDENKRKKYDAKLEEERERLKEENSIQRSEPQEEIQYQEDEPRQEYGFENLSRKEQARLKRKIEKNANEEYRKLYEDYFRSLVYKVPHRITWKEVKATIKVILIFCAILGLLWLMPFSRNWMISLYNENIVIKLIVDIIRGIFVGIGKTIQQIGTIKI